jgi:selenocysteine lyase/cysteine desulfurase
MASAHEYQMELFTTLLEGLSSLPSVRVLPAPAQRCPTVSFLVGDALPAQTALALGDQGVCVFAGDYYAWEYFEAMGLHPRGGAVRASVYHYNTAEEVERLLDGVKSLV